MPAPVVKSFAQKTGKPEAEIEKLWDEAKKLAKEQGQADNFAYITGILKKRLGLNESDLSKLKELTQRSSALRLKTLLEKTRKEILNAVDPNFIHHAQYTKELPIKNKTGVRYQSTKLVRAGRYRQYQVTFKTNSASFPEDKKSYTQKILLLDLLALIKDKKSKMTLKQKVAYAVNKGDLLVGCSDPSFLYWGYAFINTSMGTIHPQYREKRPPKERNPQQRGILCKHLNLALQVLPFNIAKIVKDIS